MKSSAVVHVFPASESNFIRQKRILVFLQMGFDAEFVFLNEASLSRTDVDGGEDIERHEQEETQQTGTVTLFYTEGHSEQRSVEDRDTLLLCPRGTTQ